MITDSVFHGLNNIAEHRALSNAKVEGIIDQLIAVINEAVGKLQESSSDMSDGPEHPSVLTELQTKLKSMAIKNQLEGCHKELNGALAKYTKLLEKCFVPDISKAYRNVEFNVQTIAEIVANYLYRKGLTDMADSFAKEAGLSVDALLKYAFQDMHFILEAMGGRNLGPAIIWAAKNRDWLSQQGSLLELRLHEMQYIQLLARGNRDESLKYARAHLGGLSSDHRAVIQKLMACLLWAGRLEQSPYADFLSPKRWDLLAEEFTREYCKRIGQPHKCPLSTVLSAGVLAVPTLVKLSEVMAMKRQEWEEMKQVPFPLDLSPGYWHHSIFVCPVLRDEASDENPPMLLVCGHVVSRASVAKLSKAGTRPFKCPYCPVEVSAAQSRELHF